MEPYRYRGCRHNLVVKQTTLRDRTGQLLPFFGLFTNASIPCGGFIGLYSGDFRKTYPAASEEGLVYILGTGYNECPYILPRVSPTMQQMYPIAMINEPPNGSSSNVCALQWSKACKVVHKQYNRHMDVICMAFHASRHIRKDEELFWHYGDLYDRSHYESPNVGTLLRIPRSKVPRHEWPVIYLEGVGEAPPKDSFLLLTDCVPIF